MALVQTLEPHTLQRSTTQDPVRCTYSIITEKDGTRLLQLDTYGSDQRQDKDKRSQSLRFTKQALAQLLAIAKDQGLIERSG